MYACLIDYEKAFDSVQHHKINIVKEADFDDKDFKIISGLYWNQIAYMKINGEEIDHIKILRGVRQGCIYSKFLTRFYTE